MTGSDQHETDSVDTKAADIVRDLAESSPPKSIETIKAAGDAAAGAIAQEKLRQRAYQLWEADGCPPGDGQDYWLKAENEQ